ncbi:type VI secretion system Vgr family protein, partial [Propionivibrio sp.]|uniref:type VI secretion system Vgr family protein n=1 Tax=Propionivibrio sp. TaxID=2212460 RepID=UPI00272E6A22
MKASKLRLDQPLSTTLSDLAAAGVSLFTQHARLLRLRFSPDSGLSPECLLPHRLHGDEGLSVGYRYTLDCLTPDTRLELKTLLGQPVELGLLLPDGGERLCTGLVTRADQVGADGGFGLFTLTVEPALALLVHRRNSRVWQDKTVPEIVAALLREHQSTHPAFCRSFTFRDATRQRYPIRSYCLQYRETDLAFLERLLAEEGIAYRYIHGPDPERSLRSADDRTDAPADDRVPAHTLVLFDDNTDLPLLTAEQTVGRTGATRPTAIRFHRTAGVETDDALDVWHGTRQFRSGKSTLL